MKIKLRFGVGVKSSTNVFLSEHPLLVIHDVKGKEDKCFIFNLTSSNHYNDKIKNFTERNSKIPLCFEVEKKRRAGNIYYYGMHLNAECKIFPIKEVALISDENNHLKTVQAFTEFNCLNKKDFINSLLLAIYENTDQVYNYDGMSSKCIKELEGFLDDDLFDELENYLEEEGLI